MTTSAAAVRAAPALPIAIRADIAGLSTADRRTVQEAVQRYAADLARDLDLAVEPQVNITPSEAGDAERLVKIGGSTGRVRRWLPGERAEVAHPDPSALARDFCEDLVANRALFVTTDVTHGWQQRQTTAMARLPTDACQALLREAITLGLRLSRLDDAAAADPAAAPDAQGVVDRAHDAALACRLQLNDDDFAAHSYGGTPEAWRDALGLPIPLTIDRAEDLGGGDFRLCVNDLSLPVRNAAVWSRMFGRPAPDEAELVSAVRRELEDYAFLLASAGTVQLLRDLLRRFQQRLADEAGRIPAPDFCRALRHLLAEHVPLTDLRGILEAMLTTHGRAGVDDIDLIVLEPPSGVMLAVAEPPGQALSPGELADVARISQGRLLAARFGPAHGALSVTLLESSMEATIARATVEERTALAPAVIRSVAAAFTMWAAFTESPSHSAQQRVLLCSGAARRLLHEMLAIEFPDVRVLSYHELPIDAEVAFASRAYMS